MKPIKHTNKRGWDAGYKRALEYLPLPSGRSSEYGRGYGRGLQDRVNAVFRQEAASGRADGKRGIPAQGISPSYRRGYREGKASR